MSDGPRRRMTAILGWQIALAVFVFAALVALALWARASGQSTGRVFVLVLTVIVALVLVIGAILVVVVRRRRN